MQAYPADIPQPNKGTLVPGQSITVNKYTVVVERYLSQGGFAHVYLVRTAQPVYNTTHHVLKRIAVPNEAMLSEVKKEVDIMRILKGHPNIVFLIDAAWHRMTNGTYEVFILMEFCPGGGIIDMMNRRLRERLTELEILTIFVEVCEGLAAMHALKPPILHRDLKVENILQASSTSYKLCDFGSAIPVQKIPTNTQELRMLEADLNRHTTLQYRAPEMIDVHLRRPIDEKSDVWALGVLLYKLCYYTTPFEEHGPLAILNVQYKIPPYPVYSAQMNSLIGSMLKEHGAQRPSVFEVLQHVHLLRGTKSRFTYNIPVKEPLSPRSLGAPLQTLSSNIANPLDELVSYRSQQATNKNAGVEAREKVLEAIAPMRRGRPAQGIPSSKTPSRPGSPEKPVAFETKFGDDEDRSWKGPARSPLPTPRNDAGSANSQAGSANSKTDGDAWSVDSRQSAFKPSAGRGFDNDFSSGFGSKFTSKPPTSTADFGDAFDPMKAVPVSSSPSAPRAGSNSQQPPRLRQSRFGKDAFEGLGLPSQPPPPPTLGEARMSRTGLASFGGSSSQSAGYNLATPAGTGLGTSNTSYRPPSIHASRPTPSPQLPQSQIQPQSTNMSPIPPPAVPSWKPNAKEQDNMSAEERFPSLEDLDRTFASPSPAAPSDKPPSMSSRPTERPPSRSNYFAALGAGAGSSAPGVKGRYDGVRSQQVTGTAMREARHTTSRQSNFMRSVDPMPTKTEDGPAGSVTVKSSRDNPVDLLGSATPALPPRPSAPTSKAEPQDWLTGNDEGMGSTLAIRTTGLGALSNPQPVLRDSPSKRASYIERSPISLARPLEAENVLPPVAAPQSTSLEREWDMALDRLDNMPMGKSERDKRRADAAKPSGSERRQRSKSPQATKAFITRGNVDMVGLGLQTPTASGTGSRLARTPSPGPNDNWGPNPSSKHQKHGKRGSSSSSDGEPEDLNGYTYMGDKPGLKGASFSNGTADANKRRPPRAKGRQSSVHDLVDLWGGKSPTLPNAPAVNSPTLPPPANKRSSVIVQSTSMKPPQLLSKPRAASPQPMMGPPSPSKAKASGSGSGFKRSDMGPPAISPNTSEFASGRSRPASMFINPVTASRSTQADLGVVSSSGAAASLAQAVSPPSDPRRRTTRRSSITDMVQHYETITNTTTGTTAKPAPGPPAKPAGLSVKTGHRKTPSASSFDYASPSAAATRFPKLSPTLSPELTKANLAVPDDGGRAAMGRDFSKYRTSPTGLPPRSSPVGRLDLPFSSNSNSTGTNITGPSINGLPARRSPVLIEQPPSRASMRDQPPPSPLMERKVSSSSTLDLPVPHANVRSPSPEKPYQGVSRLIDRWQKAVDDTGPAGGRRPVIPVKKAGVVNGGSGRA
ncbi:uncharacterized protein BXZ73DRAFT_101459 [Epithele typhae]|uniref:uncharacterized protein n=1 Tax=Epithele typhae TaxID=378194 RepID=UPI0020087E80|nr:uncharacterized protein BXZ73DRAFT_101459 [Epithele typhae]KAH9932082.1 hypothetical protein BXZ73DRAFT_101459 [Epithele typhae]